MNVQPVLSTDLDLIRELQPRDWPDIIPYIERYVEYPFCFPLKIVENSEVIGTGTLIRHVNTAWLAHIIVHPNHRNKGVGLHIVNSLLEHPEALKVKTKLLIATALGEPVYVKAGFREVSVYRYYKKEEALSKEFPSEQIKDFSQAFLSEILKIDKLVTGENREKYLVNYLKNGKVFLENGKVTGFYLPELGEGHILAITNKAGLELLKLKCSSKNKVALPQENKTATNFLKENGFQEAGFGKRMILGDDIPWQPHMMFSRIGGNLG